MVTGRKPAAIHVENLNVETVAVAVAYELARRRTRKVGANDQRWRIRIFTEHPMSSRNGRVIVKRRTG